MTFDRHPDNMTPQELHDAAKRLENAASIGTVNGPAQYGGASDSDKAKGLHHHDANLKDTKKLNFDQKVYMFPESFNALRMELHDNWPVLWALVGWRMAYRSEEFIELMNNACDVKLVLDSDNVDFICDTYLRKLRQLRGFTQ